MQTLRTSIRRKAASTPDLESRAHPYDPHRHAACQHGRRGLGTSQGKADAPANVGCQHPAAKLASTLQRSREAPCSEASKHPTAKSRSTLQRSREAPRSEAPRSEAAKQPRSEVAKHPAATSQSTLQRR